jgi:hypothetical protein
MMQPIRAWTLCAAAATVAMLVRSAALAAAADHPLVSRYPGSKIDHAGARTASNGPHPRIQAAPAANAGVPSAPRKSVHAGVVE